MRLPPTVRPRTGLRTAVPPSSPSHWPQSSPRRRAPRRAPPLRSLQSRSPRPPHAGNGLATDGHEFLITPCNTAIVLGQQVSTANLTSIGGAADQAVLDDVVQEVDITAGQVLWQWNSADHVPYSESQVPLPTSAGTPWDWFHLNAVHFDTDGNLLIDSRYTWAVYEVDARSGAIAWRLGARIPASR